MPYTIDRCPRCGCEKWASIIPDAGPQLCHVCHAKEGPAMTDQTPETAAEVRADTRERMAEYRRVILMLQDERDAALARAEAAEQLHKKSYNAARDTIAALRGRAEAAEALNVRRAQLVSQITQEGDRTHQVAVLTERLAAAEARVKVMTGELNLSDQDAANAQAYGRAAEARVRELEAAVATERDMWRVVQEKAIYQWNWNKRLTEQLSALIAAGDRLRRVSMWHDPMCDVLNTYGDKPCSCGHADAVATWERAKAGEGQDG